MGRCSDAKERLMAAITELIWKGSYGATTIDQICDKAGVKKGSFYYFFDSKASLAAAAIDANWAIYRQQYDAAFSATVLPLERLRKFADMSYQKQVEKQQELGYVLGCPLCSLGSEISTQEDVLRLKVQEVLAQILKYMESAIRDAHAEGSVDAPDAAMKARMLFAYSEGLMMQARIHNSLEILREMPVGMLALLGVRSPQLLTA